LAIGLAIFGVRESKAQSVDSKAGLARKARIGWVSWFPSTTTANLDQFRDGMRALGHAEGKTYELDATFTGGDRELTVRAIQKLLEPPGVDVLVANATPVAHIAKQATQTVPIVMLTSNALATGLVSSLARPGGNLTGVSLLLTDLSGKRLEILREMMPKLRKAAFIGSSKDPNAKSFANELESAAVRSRVELLIRMVIGPEAINQALFDNLRREGAEAVFVQPIFTGHQNDIVPMAARAKLPVVSDWSAFADAGALFTHGSDQGAAIRRMAYFVDRILKGAKPNDLPVEQPTELELVVNRKAARQLGIAVPQSVLIRATRVID
jgi:putative ABC transport system substrate-binding protein